MEKFSNRTTAGRMLAKKLKHYANHPDAIILALPRGGVPVAYEISQALHVPLDIFLVRKLGTPGQEELALGAIAMNDVTVFNQEIVSSLFIPQSVINKIIEHEKKELIRRNKVYRGNKPFPEIKDKIVILVDDGLATGATMRVAVLAIEQMQPQKIIIAVPVSAKDTYEEFKNLVDEIICLQTPVPFYGVGTWYENFTQTTDSEVQNLLTKQLLQKPI